MRVVVPSSQDDDEELARLFEKLLASGVPERRNKNLPEVERTWPCRTSPSKGAALAILRSELLPTHVLSAADPMCAPKRSRSAVRGWQGKFPSRKLNRTVRARSHLELRYIELVEFDTGVEVFVEQPCRLTYAHNQRPRTAIPDFYVEGSAGAAFVEIKWEEDASRSENEARWPSIGAAFNELGYEYRVVTERAILREPRSSNVAALLRYRRQAPPPSEIIRLVAGDNFPGVRSMDDIRRHYVGVPHEHLLRLAARGVLHLDLDQPLHASAPATNA